MGGLGGATAPGREQVHPGREGLHLTLQHLGLVPGLGQLAAHRLDLTARLGLRAGAAGHEERRGQRGLWAEGPQSSENSR